MSKLSRLEKIARREMKSGMAMIGGVVLSFPGQRVTVAISPALRGHSKTEFAHVAVAYCSEHDEFKRKRGEFEALTRFDSQYFPLRWPDGMSLDDLAVNVAMWFEYPC